MEIWSHRGDGPENTLEAFQSAWRKGITHFETDIQVTQDGVLVLAHDESLARITGIPRKIGDVTWDDLSVLQTPNKYKWTKLEDLIINFPTATISIDLKTDSAAEIFTRTFSQLPKVSKIVVGSFNAKRVNNFREIHSQCTTALTTSELMGLKFSRRKKISGNFYAMIPSRLIKFPIVTPELLSKLSTLNIPCHVWTINGLAEMHQLRNIGVDGIITDKIDLAMTLSSGK